MIEAKIVKINRIELFQGNWMYDLIYVTNGEEKEVELFFDRNDLEEGDMIII